MPASCRLHPGITARSVAIAVLLAGCYYGDAVLIVEGTVLNEAREPVNGAHVSIRLLDHPQVPVQEFVTREDGKFNSSFTAQPTGELLRAEIVIQKPGFVTSEREVTNEGGMQTSGQYVLRRSEEVIDP